MLRRLMLVDVAIVTRLELDLAAGFTVLTGETGAGKSILVDALQFVLGERADATTVRESAARAEVSAEFDAPASLQAWLKDTGFDGAEPPPEPAAPGAAALASAADAVPLLLRRVVDSQGRSRAWINGSAATVAQLREAAEHLVEIHGQHAWQRLTKSGAARELLDSQGQIDTGPMREAWAQWRSRLQTLDRAVAQRDSLTQERERLAWQIAEVDRLAPLEGEWDTLNAEHRRLAHGQALLDAAQLALDALTEAEPAADSLTSRAVESLQAVLRHDAQLQAVIDVLINAQVQLQDAAHSLHGYLGERDPDPQRLDALDQRLAAWVSLARRYRHSPSELPGLLQGWKTKLQELDAGADLQALQQAAADAETLWRQRAAKVSAQRKTAATPLAVNVSAAMQQLGMAGGRFEVALLPLETPESQGFETVEFRMAGHAGATPRALGRVASGGELSRLALAVAVSTSRAAQASAQTQPATLIFDEIDSGVGGQVADQVGRLMKHLGGSAQVMAVTHLAQVASCADQHFVVSKSQDNKGVSSRVVAVHGESRVAEVARMLGGERLTGTSRAHAAAMLESSARRAIETERPSASGSGNSDPITSGALRRAAGRPPPVKDKDKDKDKDKESP